MVARTVAGGIGLTADWDEGSSGWKDAMDDNLLWLSVIVQGRVIDQVLAEPGSPAEGDIYLLAAAHGTHPNALAVYDEGSWHYRTPLAGWRFFNTTLGLFTQFSGTAWVNDAAALTAEDVRDTIAAALVSGSNVTITPNDGSDTITIAATGGSSGPTNEEIMDLVATLLTAGSNVTLTYNDGADTLTVASSGGLTDAPSDGAAYTRKNGAWVEPNFLDLENVPATFAGQASRLLSVLATEDGVEFIDRSDVGGGGGVASGTAFPGSPSSGDLFYRSDRAIEYYYDGTRWLSTQLFSMNTGSFSGVSVTSETYFPVPYAGVYGLYLERFEATMLRNGAGEWDFTLGWRPASNATTNDAALANIDGAGDTTVNWYSKSATIGAVLNATAKMLIVKATEVSGTATFTGAAMLFYRLVG